LSGLILIARTHRFNQRLNPVKLLSAITASVPRQLPVKKKRNIPKGLNVNNP
jgi:hypothetical protein